MAGGRLTLLGDRRPCRVVTDVHLALSGGSAQRVVHRLVAALPSAVGITSRSQSPVETQKPAGLKPGGLLLWGFGGFTSAWAGGQLLSDLAPTEARGAQREDVEHRDACFAAQVVGMLDLAEPIPLTEPAHDLFI